MTYGTIKVDTVTFTDAGIDKSVTLSGLVQNPTFSGNVTVTGTLSGVTVTGTTANFTSGNFTNISGGTHTITSGVFAAGSAASPSITFTGDLNTGIYSPGADQVAISTNSVGRVFVGANGNVGIGTSSPQYLVHAASAVGVGDDVGYRVQDTTNSKIIQLMRTGSSFSYIGIGGTEGVVYSDNTLSLAADNSNPIKFCAGGSERLRITSAGLVGVGTSSPGYALDTVASSGSAVAARFRGNGGANNNTQIRFYGNNAATDQWAIGGSVATSDTGRDFHIYDLVANANRLAIDSSGRVGVGTTSPSDVLDTAAGNYRGITIKCGTTTNRPTLSFFNTADSLAAYIQAIGSSLAFGRMGTDYGGHTESARIDSSGRVGIGTSVPETNLDVRFATNPGTDNGAGYNALRSFTTSATAINTGGAIALGGAYHTNGAVASFGQIAGRKENSTNGDLSGYLQFCTNTGGGTMVERARIDAAGRLGIGTTSPGYVLDVSGSARVKTGATGTPFIVATGGDSQGTIRFGSTSFEYSINGGADYLSLIFNAGGSERARIDSSGRLLVGTSSGKTVGAGQYSLLNVQGYVGASNGGGDITLSRGETASNITTGEVLGLISFTDSAGYAFAQFYCEADGTAGTNDYPGRLVFSTTADGASSPTERMRINSSGYLKYSNSGSYAVTNIAAGTEAYHQVVNTGSGFGVLISARDSAGTAVAASVTSTAASGDLFRGYVEASGGIVYRVFSNGNVENTNNSYGALSDIKLKENIVDANSQWDDIKALQVRNYNLKEGQTHTQIGLVAQEVELVSPGLVTESPDRDAEGNDLGTVTKSVNYSVLYMKAVKALQEAMERIETLEAKVAALESA